MPLRVTDILPADRLTELAAIMAKAIIRLRLRAQESPPVPEIGLELPAATPLSVPRTAGLTAVADGDER